MVGNTLVTSVTHTEEKATAGKQKPYWVEIQLVDEQGDPVANIPWRAESSHPVSGPVDNLTYTGQSQADGLIRIDMPHGLELRLAKLYLVPALAEQEMQQAGQKQKEFKASLTQADLTDFFPKGCNPDRGVNVNIFDHFMTSYMPYMYNKVLELIDNAGIVEKRTFTEHQYNVDSFREQMAENKNDIPERELVRNNIFLNIEGLLDASLSPTLFMPSGNDTLLRFAQYGEEVMENV
ncbi:hypothetical protein G893_03389 [Escherichia coli KOEGE 71 (186a)]|uniref:hypothetical protein n=1 Tax=Escherichia coli TaxID=562 RepID=UPI00039184BC|nr:hypothetical protein [Escherichia coli]EQV89314.1 hypothetical protein G893_03389 [Escherichia coli KOEGE 71 (186a)]